jgi:ankyrin repeat protein
MLGLLDAVRVGDLERVKRLVKEGADVKETNFEGYTPFLYAAVFGRIPIMHWLLTEGDSSLTELTIHRNSALMLAALGYHFAVMQYCWRSKEVR